MTWWAWRQHRAQVLAAAGVLAALAIWMVVTGLSFAHEYRDLGIASCLAARGDCGQAIDQFEALHRGIALLVPLFLIRTGARGMAAVVSLLILVGGFAVKYALIAAGQTVLS